jgi:hypothetical protein
MAPAAAAPTAGGSIPGTAAGAWWSVPPPPLLLPWLRVVLPTTRARAAAAVRAPPTDATMSCFSATGSALASSTRTSYRSRLAGRVPLLPRSKLQLAPLKLPPLVSKLALAVALRAAG